MIKKSIFTVLLIGLLSLSHSLKAQLDTAQQIDYSRKNSPTAQAQPYVILLSLDGFRWDLAAKYNAQNILSLAQSGVQAEKLIPSYPSLTFPNHYTVVTGQHPAHHGLVDNHFYESTSQRYYVKSSVNGATDSTWYGGTPLWMLAEAQGMLSAVYFWPGSEHSKNGIRPSYYYKYNEVTPLPNRMQVVRNWLQLPPDRRPHFIAIYFPEIDKAAHKFTAESEAAKNAVLQMDAMIGQLQNIMQVSSLAINLVIVSDHGMTAIDQSRTIPKPKALQSDDVVVPVGNALLNVHVKDKQKVPALYKQLKLEAEGYEVYLQDKTPKKWHIRSKDDHFNRIGDIVLIPTLPRVFNINNRMPDPGQHGFQANHPDMAGIFYAAGPQFKSNITLKPFQNIHIYPLIAKILNLDVTEKIDGKLKVLKKVLK
ncbi:MAG: alkaline phosphatase family protein [Pedobacter sp.]|nr:MAG: alkaline phosphatase family protein [Pedobacter sp.]